MKFSAALSLSVATLASAKSVRNSYPVRRDPNQVAGAQAVSFQNGMAGFGVTETSLTEVILIWVNPGAGAATTTLNQQVTVTQTVTVNGGGVAGAPPGAAAPTPPVGGTPTLPQAGTSVIVGGGQTHPVTVGGPAGLVFTPDNVKAAIGDVVVFTFLGNNHTATQSAFTTPCDPLAGGMDSGFMTNPNNTVTPAPQVAMQVMVSDPLWFYCKQNAHCGKGMTFSINPTGEKSQALFQQMAIQQKGAGAGSAITGGTPPAPPAAAPAGGAPPPAAAPPAPSAGQLQPLPGATQVAGAPAAPGGVVSGSGTINADGSCTCAVSCGAGAFPAIEAQGVGSFGGMAGSLPLNMVEA